MAAAAALQESSLLKAGRLDPPEWAVMQQHVTIGAQILAGSESAVIQLAEVVALTYHELSRAFRQGTRAGRPCHQSPPKKRS